MRKMGSALLLTAFTTFIQFGAQAEYPDDCPDGSECMTPQGHDHGDANGAQVEAPLPEVGAVRNNVTRPGKAYDKFFDNLRMNTKISDEDKSAFILRYQTPQQSFWTCLNAPGVTVVTLKDLELRAKRCKTTRK